jgi:beta-galactosidase
VVAGLTPHADVTLLYSNATKWSLEQTPALHDDVGQPDRRSYETIFEAFYRGAFDAGLQARIVHPSQLFDTDPADAATLHPVIVAAGYLIAADDQLRWLERYAAAGGHLIIGIRTGYEDEQARARVERKPAFLAEAAGAFYDEFSTLDTPIVVRATPDSPLAVPDDAHATRWIDGLTPTGGDTLAEYQHPHFGRWPAITGHGHGAGRVTYVGTVPNPALAAALFDWVLPAAERSWRPQTDSQTVNSATARDGSRLRFVHNWSFDPSTYKLPTAVDDISSGETFPQGAELSLASWDVRILRELS